MVEIEYLDAGYQPVLLPAGYASLVREYDEYSHKVRESRFDEKRRPLPAE